MIQSRLMLLTAVALSAFFLISMYLVGVPEGHSFTYNVAWHTQFSKLLWAGEIFPKYGPDLAYGFGGMDLYFYAPLPFYVTSTLGEVFTFFSHSYDALAVGGGWLFIFSGFTFYYFARSIFAAWPSFVASVFYAIGPYHFGINWIGRQAIGEVTAAIFVPIIALGLVRLLKGNGGLLLLLIGFTGLTVSHLPTLVLALLYFVPLGFLLAWKVPKYREQLPHKFGLAFIVGVLAAGISAFYVYPALSLLSDLSPEYLTDYSNRAEVYVLFCVTCSEGSIFPVFTTSVLLGYFGIFFLLWRNFKDKGRADIDIWIYYFFGLSVFLNTVLVLPLWSLPIIEMIQFPWRSFLYLEFAAALALAYVGSCLSDYSSGERKTKLIQFATLSGLYLCALIFYAVSENRSFFPRDRALPMVSALEYMNPIAGKHFEEDLIDQGLPFAFSVLEMESYIEKLKERTKGFENFQQQGRGFSFTLADQNAVLPIFSYPRMQAMTIDGRALDTNVTKEGLVSIDNGPLRTKINYSMPYLDIERRGKFISLISLLLAISLFVFLKIRKSYLGN